MAQAAFRSTTRMVTETVYVDGDLLCEQSENMFGRPDCGPVYKRGDDAGNGYTYRQFKQGVSLRGGSVERASVYRATRVTDSD